MKEFNLEKIISDYERGVSLRKLGTEYKTRDNNIRSILIENNVRIRKRGEQVDKTKYINRKYTINEDYFENINTSEKAYWVGFLFADGCVTNKYRRRNLELALKREDAYHIDNLSFALGSNKKTKDKDVFLNGKKYLASRCSWSSKKLVEDLIKTGCVEKKSLSLDWVKNICDDFIGDFVRGYFDGDGCVYYDGKYGRNVQILGTESFLSSMSDFLTKHGVVNRFAHRKGRNYFVLYINGIDNLKRFYNVCYKNSNENNRLGRKYKKFNKMLRDKNMI